MSDKLIHVGIVGSEAKKFTPEGERQARTIIEELLSPPNTVLVSGHCHLGGIDIYAEEIANRLGRSMQIFAPAQLSWPYYKARNTKIAVTSDIVHCITVDRLPSDFTGMTHPKCYHCNSSNHVKSGGCWTMLRAKVGKLWIVENFP